MYPSGRYSDETMSLQRALILNGFDVGKDGADGIMGSDTIKAVIAAREHYGLAKPSEPRIDLPLLLALGVRSKAPTPPLPKPNFLTGLALKAILSHLKGLPMFANLTGHKTVITGIIMVVSGAVSLIAPLIGLGDVAGFNALSPGEAWTALTTGFGLIFLRQGMANEVSSTK
jgi:peptidoglycan hydrolase-like protein with peptidoglycan-binding domain